MRRRWFKNFGSQPWLFAGALSVALLIVNIITAPNFAHPDNIPRHLVSLAPLALVAIASTPPIVSGNGGIDLSVGPLAVLCNVIFVHLLLPNGLGSFWVSVPLLLLLGALIGFINGFLSSALRYVPVIATLCMAFILMGLIEKIGAQAISAGDNWTQALTDSVGPISGAALLIAAPIAIWLAMKATSFHRNLYAAGGNDVTAFSAGVNVTATRIIAFTTGGMFAAIGGFALTALVQSSQAQAMTFFILVGLTAVALGGTSLGGGRGGLTGAIFGATALYLMQSLLTSVNVSPEWINVVYGTLLVIGVVVAGRKLSGITALLRVRPRGSSA